MRDKPLTLTAIDAELLECVLDDIDLWAAECERAALDGDAQPDIDQSLLIDIHYLSAIIHRQLAE